MITKNSMGNTWYSEDDICGGAGAYETADGTTIRKEEIDLLSRMMSMQKSHPSYAMTGAMCTAAAAVVPGSVVAQVLNPGHGYQVYPYRTSGRSIGMWRGLPAREK